jgi:uncharacterized membrane protein (TIGR02234 family)
VPHGHPHLLRRRADRLTTAPAGTSRRRGFAPTVVAGLASAGLTAVAANQPWATAEPEDGQFAFTTLTEAPQVPLVLTLALVVLAAWGVLLVTRGRVRRVVSWLGALAAVGALVAAVVGRWTLEDSFNEDFADQGATAVVDLGAWWWVAVVATALSAATAVLAATQVGRWPEMGTRYDAPGTTAETPQEAPAEERTNLDLWKSIDEGHDPTA